MTANRPMEEIRRLRIQIAAMDCRHTLGSVADVGGSHCQIDNPCQRCQLERLKKWQIDICDSTGFSNHAEGTGGYEIAEPEVVVSAFKEKDAEIERLRALTSEPQCEGCGRFVDPDPTTPEGRGHQVPNDDGSPGYCGPITYVIVDRLVTEVERLRARNELLERLAKAVDARRVAIEARDIARTEHERYCANNDFDEAERDIDDAISAINSEPNPVSEFRDALNEGRK